MERFKVEKISLYKLFLTASLTAFFGVVGFFFINRGAMSNFDKILVEFTIVFLIALIVVIIYRTRYYIDLLRDAN